MPQGNDNTAQYCSNCGMRLLGAYCHQCGQAARLHRSLLQLAHEGIHDLLHFDTKGWRTLPLLILRPGVLTRRYIDGQRRCYLAPFPLFLFCVFLLFFVYSLFGSSVHVSAADSAAAQAELTREIEQDRAELARARTERTRQGRSSAAADSDRELGETQIDLAAAQAVQRSLETAQAATPQSRSAGTPSDRGEDASASMERAWSTALASVIHTGSPSLDRRLHQQLNNPELFLYKLRGAASKFAFLLIPISLPFLWLMFLGRPAVTVYDHAVFSLYSLSFMALLFVVAAILAAVGAGAVLPLLLLVVPPLHMFVQLRGTYQLGVAAALWRTVALIGVAGTAFLLFLVFIAAMTLG